MMDFIYELYQNDNFVLYLTIALVILIILFVLVLIFGKCDQKLEETKRLQKIELDAFKEENKSGTKVEVKNEELPKTEEIEEKKEEVINTPAKVEESISLSNLNLEEDDMEVTTFIPKVEEEPIKEEIVDKPEIKIPSKPLIDIDEENKPINMQELDEIKFDELSIENDLNELENIKKEFDSIKIPEVKEEKKEVKVEEKKGYNAYKPGPRVFSSVFVNSKDEEKEQVEIKEAVKPVINEEKPKVNLFSIADEEEEVIELPSLKKEPKIEGTSSDIVNFDKISGETYDIK